MGEEVKMATTMNSVKEHPRKRCIFTKKYFTEELKSAGALKIKTTKGVKQMALCKVSDVTIGLVVAAKGTKSFPDSVIVKWIKTGSKMTQRIERQFSMFDQLVQYLKEVFNPEDVEKWKDLLRTDKYVFPVEDEGWLSIFSKETFLNFEIQLEQLLTNLIDLKENNVEINSDANILPMPDNSLENSINSSEITCKSHHNEKDVSSEVNKNKLTSKQTQYSNSESENNTIESIFVQPKEIVDNQKNDLSISYVSKLDKEDGDHQKDDFEETMYENICKNDEGIVSNFEKNIFRDARENSLQRLSIEYNDVMEPDNAKNSSNIKIDDNYSDNQDNDVMESDNATNSSNIKINDHYSDNQVNDLMESDYAKNSSNIKINDQYSDNQDNDVMESDNATNSSNIKITDSYSEKQDESLNICEDHVILRKIEKSNESKFYESNKESLKMQQENALIEENNSVEKCVSPQFHNDSPQMDINYLNIEELPIGYAECKEKTPLSKSLSKIIPKKKRKKRSVQEDASNEIFKSYRVVIMPEDPQCSYCERITHTFDTCPDRKRIKANQNTTSRVKRYKKKRTYPSDLEMENTNSTFSVLKCAIGSRYLYKTKSEITPHRLKSSNNIYINANFQPKAEISNLKRVEPFVSKKWNKTSTKTFTMKYDVEKKKKELLSKQIKELKELLNLFTNNKSNMTLEVKKSLLITIKSLQTSIDNIRQQFNNNLVNKNPITNIKSNTVVYNEQDSSTKVQNVEKESEKEKYEELTKEYMINVSPKYTSEICYSPKSLLSPMKLHNDSPVNDIENNDFAGF